MILLICTQVQDCTRIDGRLLVGGSRTNSDNISYDELDENLCDLAGAASFDDELFTSHEITNTKQMKLPQTF